MLLLLVLAAAAVAAASTPVTCVGHVFVDANGNGVQESFELNAQGIVMSNSDGATTLSNAQGNYLLAFADANALNNTFTVAVPEGGMLTSAGGTTRPALTSLIGPCVLNTTGLANVLYPC